MIFVRAQALDNLSEDPCVLAGQVVNAADPAAARTLSELSRTMLQGRPSEAGSTQIIVGPYATAFKIDTGDRDVGGRVAPIIALTDSDWERDIAGTAQAIAECARLINRTVDAVRLASDLDSWSRLGKLRRFIRRIWRGMRKRLRRQSAASRAQ